MTQYHKAEVVEFTNGSFWQRMKFPPGCRERYLDVNRDRHRWIDEHHINLGGISDLRKSYEIHRVCPPFHIALFCIEGRAWLRTGRAKRILKPGDLFLGPAGSQYAYGADTQWSMAWFHLAPHSHWNDTFGKMPRRRRGRWTGEIAHAFKALFDETDLQAADSKWLCDAHERLLVGYLNRELGIQRQVAHEDTMLRLYTLAQIIYDQPAEPWTVGELARRAGWSVPQLHRLMKQYHNTGPMGMVLRIRMEQAKGALLRSHATLEEIAQQFGYSSAFTFSRAFKKYSGQSPDMFRCHVVGKY